MAVADSGGGAILEQVRRVLAAEVAPLLQMDGAAIEVIAVEDGVVRLRLGNVCGGCPGTIQAVLFGLEEELRRRVAGVEYLEIVP
jgi:Fe-S cluster biogenesis protein NfuA